MVCPACGYVFGPLETECRRCARRAAQPCGNCGRPGVVTECRECGREICSACAVAVAHARFCLVCAPGDLAARHKAELAASGSTRPLPGPGFVAQVALPGDQGLRGNARRGFAFMRESLAMAFRDKDLLIPPLLSVICSIGFLVGALLLLGTYAASGGFLSHAYMWGPLPIIIGAFAFIFGCWVITYFITYFFAGMTVHLINVHLRGRDAKLPSAFRDAVRNTGALLLLAGASAVVSLLTALIRGLTALMSGVKVLGRFIAAAGDSVASAVDGLRTVVVCLLLPIIIIEDVSLGKAIERAREIHAGNLIPIALAEIGVGMVNGFIGLAFLLLAYAAVHYARVSAPSSVTPTLVAVGVALVPVVAYTGFVRTAYYTCLYLWAVERSEARESAAVPRPLAVALTS